MMFLEKLLLRILARNSCDFQDIDEKRMKEWLESLQGQYSGFRDYFKYRDLQILKTMGVGLSDREYWIYCGRRTELLQLAGKSKEILDKKRSEDKKGGLDKSV